MGEGRTTTALAVDLLRAHGPLTIGELQALLPREWHNRLTGHPGYWLAQNLRRRSGVSYHPATKRWDAAEEAPDDTTD